MNAKPDKSTSRLLAALIFCATAAHAEIVLSEAPEPPAAATARTIKVPEPAGAESDEKPKAAEPGAVIQFANGDKLHGELLSIEPERGLRWASPQAKEPIEFSLGSARMVSWENREGRDIEGAGVATIELTNGDELTGRLVSLDGEALQLETWYAGALTIPRKRLQTITPMDTQGGPIFAGPDGMKGWKVSGGGGRGNRGWRYADGAFEGVGNGVIGRMFELPPSVAIDFDMGWRGQLQLAVTFCSDRPDTSSRDAYNMQINNNYVYVQRMSRDRGSHNLGQTEVPELLKSSPVRIGIRVSKEESTVSLLVNGALVKQWTDRGNFAGGGGGIAFYTQGSSAVQIKKLRIAKWDGKFPTKASAGEVSEQDTVTLENSDTVSGTIESIRDGEASLKSQYATLKIPFDRLQSVRMAGKGTEAAKREKGDLRAAFVNGGSVTLKLESWTEKGLRGTSANFGTATFDQAAFEKLDFEPDAKEEAVVPMGDGEGGEEFVE